MDRKPRPSAFQRGQSLGKRPPVAPLDLRYGVVERVGDEPGQGAVTGPVDRIAQSFEQIDRKRDRHTLLATPSGGGASC